MVHQPQEGYHCGARAIRRMVRCPSGARYGPVPPSVEWWSVPSGASRPVTLLTSVSRGGEDV
eukprot:9554187-Karenia_brevis.AAC.1